MHVQPQDQGIIKAFKAHYHAKYIQRAVNCYDAGITPSEIYNIDRLQAMRLADAAWREVDAATIRHCWHKANILPEHPHLPLAPSLPISAIIDYPDPVDKAQKLVKAALDDLVPTGALQNSNRMSIDALLNPADELNILDDTTEDSIFDAVMDSRMVSGSQGDDISKLDMLRADSLAGEVGPTQKEALQAAIILEKYMQHINDPFACKLEGMLGSFGQQTHLSGFQNMRPTLVTDYFSHP